MAKQVKKKNPKRISDSSLGGLFSEIQDVKEEKVSRSTKLYFQIHRSNLPKYFTYGIITPACYFENRVIDDVQSSYKEYLVFGNGKIGTPSKENVFLEIYLSSDEKKGLIKHGDLLLYPKPIPISRVTSIHTFNRSATDFIISILKTQDAGPIPNHLFNSSFPRGLKKIVIRKESPESIPEEILNTNKTHLDRYDRVLGALALMKNSMLYYTDSNRTYENYPDHIFSLLSHVNSKISTDDIKMKRMFKSFVNPSSNAEEEEEVKEIKFIIDFILSKQDLSGTFLDDFLEMVLKDEDDLDFKKEMSEVIETLKRPVGRKKALVKIRNAKNKKRYFFTIVAFLYLYHRTSDIEILKHNITQEIPDKYRASEILSFLGFHYGYSKLRPYERLALRDSHFNKLKKDVTNIKFELDSKFDYIIIESVFYAIFENEKEDHIEFVKRLINPLKQSNIENEILKSISKNPKYLFEKNVKVFEKLFFKIKLRTDEELIIDFLENYPERISMDYLLFSFLAKYFPGKVEKEKSRKINLFFDKKWFIEHLEENEIKDINHITYCLEGDQKFNFNKK